MRHDLPPFPESASARPRVGSLFSGYGGLVLAVEHVFDAKTVWFSEINEPVARVFARRWPETPNLGDITTIGWASAPPVDILCGGFPCQDVSTVGKMAGLAPGTRSGLWSHMAAAIEHLRPEWVVIENVRGLLSATATRATPEGADDATLLPSTIRNLGSDLWCVGNVPARPLRALGGVLGDLADLQYDAWWIDLPASAIGAPHPRFRVFVLARPTAAHPARVGRLTRRGEPRAGTGASGHDRALASDHRPRLERASRLAHMEARTGDAVAPDRGHLHRWGRYAHAIARWEHITESFAPSPALLHDSGTPRPAPAFLEWLMGLEHGWVTDPVVELTANQQMAALGNGVLPLQATIALRGLLNASSSYSPGRDEGAMLPLL